MMHPAEAPHPWGITPWKIEFRPPKRPVPASVDFAVIGGGFTGLATAAWLKVLDPAKSVVVLEAAQIGTGASGRTGGLVLDKTAADDLPGLGDVLAGLQRIVAKLRVECNLTLPGVWEVARGRTGMDGSKLPPPRPDSTVEWNDSGTLRVVNEVSGGSLDPGKMVSELARAGHELGVIILEDSPAERVTWSEHAEIHFLGRRVRAGKVLFANNAQSLELSGLKNRATPKLTLAARIAPLSEEQIGAIGLAERKPFYTVDLPYLWGRLCRDHSIVWGAGLVDAPKSGDVGQINVRANQSARMFAGFQTRVRNFHPALRDVEFTHQWGGPILFRDNWEPVFGRHPENENGIVLGAYAGHGVALSVYLGAWAAEALLDRRELPEWGRIDSN
jgi:glycine/D-amino acid oxidase-like deaminating enzyme